MVNTAPMIIIERPFVSIAFCANSLATCVTNSGLIPVTRCCHAGVYFDSDRRMKLLLIHD